MQLIAETLLEEETIDRDRFLELLAGDALPAPPRALASRRRHQPPGGRTGSTLTGEPSVDPLAIDPLLSSAARRPIRCVTFVRAEAASSPGRDDRIRLPMLPLSAERKADLDAADKLPAGSPGWSAWDWRSATAPRHRFHRHRRGGPDRAKVHELSDASRAEILGR